MFQVKICGITRVEDALLAADAGADAIGLNFYPQSSRFVSIEGARAITDALRKLPAAGRPEVVGVFVNSDPDWINQACESIPLNAIQCHGDETALDVARLSCKSRLRQSAGLPAPQVLRAFRCQGSDCNVVQKFLCECQGASAELRATVSVLPHAILLDAYAPGVYGGTGQVVDWSAVHRDRPMMMGLPVILAGGLTAENVAEAIETARPDGVDTASGVEDAPGRKSAVKVRCFVAAARAALDRVKSLP